jgi:transposase
MIPITPNMRLLVGIEPVDGRKGIDGLVHLCRTVFSCDPMEDGALVVVRNRSAKSIRLLAYDGQGWWLAQKRLSTGKFKYWPEAVDGDSASCRQLLAHSTEASAPRNLGFLSDFHRALIRQNTYPRIT